MNRQSVALIIMVLGAFFASFLSLISVLSSEINVFTLVTFSGLVAVLVHIPFILKSEVRGSGGKMYVDHKFFSLSVVGGVFVMIGYAIFIMAIRQSTNPLVPTIIFEAYPLGIILCSNILIKKEVLTRAHLFWLFISGLGILIVMIGSSEYGIMDFYFDQSSLLSFVGVLLLSIGAVTVSCAFKERRNNVQRAFLASFYARIGGVFVTALFVPYDPSLISSIVHNIDFIILYGLFIFGLTNICYYGAIHFSDSHLINNVWYITPVLGLFWLWVFGLGSFSFIILLGAILIVLSNYQINKR